MAGMITRGLAVVGASAILVVGFDAATYAATGSSLILGKSNSAGAATTIARTTAGPVLSLKTTTSSSAPFSTNATGMVTNLNANRVGGNTAAQLIAKASPSTVVYADAADSRGAPITYANFQRPAGTYLVTFDMVVDFDVNGSPGSPSQATCWLQVFGGEYLAQGTTVSIGNDNFDSLSFSTVVTLAATTTLQLQCDSPGWNASGTRFGPRLTFTKVAAPTGIALENAP